MTKLFLFMMISLDGFFEGLNHDLSWHSIDAEFNEYAIEQTKNVDTLLFGRRTYELMRDFWPTEDARKADPVVANLMNNTPKIVFSKSLQEVKETQYWKNVRLVKDNIAEEVKELKKETSPPSPKVYGEVKKDLAVYGSSNLCVSLLEYGLLDELRVMVNPVVIGKGTTLFHGIREKQTFKLVKTKKFHNGNILLTYRL